MTMIDLGLRETPEPVSPISPRHRRRLLRNVAVAVVAVLCAAFVTASAPAVAPHALRTLWRTLHAADGRVVVVGDLLILVDHGDLVGYGLRDGVEHWSRAAPEHWQDLVAAPEAGVIAMPSGNRSGEVDSDTGEQITEPAGTLVIDAATGQDRWSSPFNTLLAATATDLLMARYEPSSDTIDGLQVAAAADGTKRWDSGNLPVSQWVWTGPDKRHPTGLATVDTTGAIAVHRLSDGTTAAHDRIRDWSPDGSYPLIGSEQALLAAGDSVIVSMMVNFKTTVTAYAADTWHQRWQVTGGANASVFPCGPGVCSLDHRAMTFYDPVTGAVRWQLPDTAAGLTGDASGPLVVNGNLIDLGSGRTIAEVGFRSVLGTGDFVVLGRALPAPSRQVVITVVDPGTGRQFVLGTVSGNSLLAPCKVVRDLLICRDGGILTVTTVHPDGADLA